MNLPGEHSRFRGSSALPRKAQGCGCDSQLSHLLSSQAWSYGLLAGRSQEPLHQAAQVTRLMFYILILSGVLRRNSCSQISL